MWRTIKAIINKNTEKFTEITSLKINNLVFNDSRLMADHLNEFFY
jgi:hypothetical protein